MTEEDKKIIAGYMGWLTHPKGDWYDTPVYFAPGIAGDVNFDLNDAGLVVAEMVSRGDWLSFIAFADNEHFDKEISAEFSAWFFNSEHFFNTFVEWRKSRP